jgi:luciferase family oxidoreductase group 1
MSFPLSVLDLVPIMSGSTSSEALRNSIDLAKRVDQLGYTRYWFAEHHNMSSIASPVPEVMIGQVARETSQLRVGSGGVMLPNHPPLKIAETFRMLEALYPGRIDLGIGRAPGTDPLTAYALRRNKEALNSRDFPEHMSELLAFASNEFPDDHPFKAVVAMPSDVGFPDIWMLGSSANGAQVAASLGVAFAFAHHINPQNAVPAFRSYRDRFQPSQYLTQPYSLIAVSLTCAETDEEAERLASSVALAIVRLRSNQPIPFPSPEEALAYPYTPTERAAAKAYRTSTQIVGSPKTVRRELDRLVEATGADEVMVVSLIHSHAARVRSYELLAEEYGLVPAVAAT